jgi:hypothetical protein
LIALLVPAGLLLWFAASLVNQIGPRFAWSRRIADAAARYDVCHLIPNYRYFAPHPPAVDLELLYRDRLRDGSLTRWHTLNGSTDSAWRRVWNPGKRRYAVVSKRGLALLRAAPARLDGRPADPRLSTDYLALARYVSGATHSLAGDATQFAIAVDAGVDARTGPAIAFVSPFFRL